MPAASVPLTIAVALCVVLTSSLPTGFTLVAGALVGALPEAIAQGLGSAAGDRTMVALGALGLIFVAQQILAPLQATAADALGRRLMAVNARQIMQATLGPAGVAHLEESGYVDQIFRALPEQSVGPRAAVSALVGDTTSRVTAVAGLALVAYFQWWLAILLLVALIHKVHRYGPIRRQLVTVRMGKAPELRRANYFLDLTLRPEAAKEIRIFGLAEWFVERYRGAWLGAMAELWTAR